MNERTGSLAIDGDPGPPSTFVRAILAVPGPRPVVGLGDHRPRWPGAALGSARPSIQPQRGRAGSRGWWRERAAGAAGRKQKRMTGPHPGLGPAEGARARVAPSPSWRNSVVRLRSWPARGRPGTVLTFTHRGAWGVAQPPPAFTPPETHAFLDRLEAHLAGQPLPPVGPQRYGPRWAVQYPKAGRPSNPSWPGTTR